MSKKEDKNPDGYITVRECAEKHLSVEHRLTKIEQAIKNSKYQISTLVVIVNILLVIMLRLWK